MIKLVKKRNSRKIDDFGLVIPSKEFSLLLSISHPVKLNNDDLADIFI